MVKSFYVLFLEVELGIIKSLFIMGQYYGLLFIKGQLLCHCEET